MENQRGRGNRPRRGQGADGARGGGPARGGGVPRGGGMPPMQSAWGARGRATGGPPPGLGAAPARPPQQAPAQPQGVWGQNIRAMAPPAPVAAAGRGGGEPAAVGHVQGEREHPGQTSRGAYRGGKMIQESRIVKTKPEGSVKQGTSGRRVVLRSNYFKLEHKPDWCMYQYRVDFAPNDDLTTNRRKLFRMAVENHPEYKGSIFDGTVLWMFTRLPTDPTELFVQHHITSENTRVTIKLVGDLVHGDYSYLHVFNLIIRNCMRLLDLQLVGRNFFDARSKINIQGESMEIWPGFISSIRQHEKDILLMCEITNKVMRQDTVLHLLRDLQRGGDRRGGGRGGGGDYRGGGGDYQSQFMESIIGSVVLTDYNNKTYRVDDVDFSMSPASTFEKKDGQKISFVQYYKDRYNLKITDMQQPLLVSKAKAREIRSGQSETILLIPELCRMTGLTDQQRANFTLMRNLATYTRLGPDKKQERLAQYSKRLRDKPEIMKEFEKYDLRFSKDIIEFSGRILPPETILFNGGNERVEARDGDWTYCFKQNRALYSVPDLSLWAVVYPANAANSTNKFIEMLKQVSTNMRWTIPHPKLVSIPDDRVGTYMNTLDSILPRNPKLVMCVAMNNRSDRYNAIKKKCLVDFGISNQVMTVRKMDDKGAMSIATKVAIQMMCKVGGGPWTVVMPDAGGGIMYFGFDVCHDPQNKSKSYGALIGSIDANVTRCASMVANHSGGEELSNFLANGVVQLLSIYGSVQKKLPNKIIFYRDAVGDGQIPYVHEHEVGQIENAVNAYYKSKNVKGPGFTFIIVSKRINTRFFMTAGDPSRNPPPGTVVDDVVTLPDRYDFYLIPQCSKQGTVTPTHYNIIRDSCGYSADKLQILSYKLCHVYYNWSGTVRVPSVVQYAHKLAFLAANSLRADPNARLNTLLYFL